MSDEYSIDSRWKMGKLTAEGYAREMERLSPPSEAPATRLYISLRAGSRTCGRPTRLLLWGSDSRRLAGKRGSRP